MQRTYLRAVLFFGLAAFLPLFYYLAVVGGELRRPRENQSPNLRSIVDRIRPSVEELLGTDPGHGPDALLPHAVRANVRASANQLRHGSEVLEQFIQSDGLLVVGAEYSLETGVVEFFDGLPGTR